MFDMGAMIDLMTPLLMFVLIISLIMQLLKPIFSAVPSGKKEYISKDAGDRLKKYLYNAGKLNAARCNTLYMRNSDKNSGGKLGKIIGVIPSEYVTRFVIKRGWIMGVKKFVYCPTAMHTNLSGKEVYIDAIGIENAGGFYFPVPDKSFDNKKVFNATRAAFRADMQKMQVFDMEQIIPTQVEKAIAGEREIRERMERAPEEMEFKQEQGQGGGGS